MGERSVIRGRILLVAVLMFFSFLIFVKSADFNVAPSLINVDEDASNLYNFTIENTNSTTNITQVDITLPSGFVFQVNTNGTSSTGVFSNDSTNFFWNDASLILNNTNHSFWFNATAANPGAYNITITTLDTSSVVNSKNISVVVNDTTIPSSINFVDPTPNNNSNFSKSNIPVNVTFTDNGIIDTITIRLFNSTKNQINLSSNSSPSSSQLFVNFTGLNDGIYYINATVNDTGGNSNSTETRKITLDTLGPYINFTTPTTANGTYSRNSISVNITANDATTLITGINITLFYSNGSIYNSSFSATSPFFLNFTGLSDGIYILNATANDSVNNKNSTETRSYILDTLAPNVIQFNSPANGANLSKLQTINATVNDTTLSVSRVIFNITNSSGQVFLLIASNTSNDLWNATLNTSNLSDGNYNITIYANDTIGNLNNSEKITIRIDNTFPLLNSSNITGAFYNGTDYIFSPANQDNLYDNVTIVMNASELIKDWGTTRIFNSSGNSVKFFFGPNNVYSNIEVWKGGFTETVPPFVPDGFYNINTTLNDSAGNNNAVFVARIYVDNSPPAFSNHTISPSPQMKFKMCRLMLL